MRRIAAKVTLGVLAILAGIGGCNLDQSGEIFLLNQDTDIIHILRETESFGPQNRLQPGASRFVPITGDDIILGEVTFVAGRNEVVLSRVTCAVGLDEDDELDVAPVAWDGQNLTCSN